MEKTIFIEYFGESPVIKVFGYILDNHLLDFSKSDVARVTKIARMTLDNIWKNLAGKDIIKPTRVIGRSKLYKLNLGNQFVKALLNFEKKLINLEIQRASIKV